MLIALLLAQLLGVMGLGGPVCDRPQQETLAELKSKVARTVVRPERNRQAVKIVEAMERETREFNERFNDSAREISRLVARYDTSRSTLRATIDQLDCYGDEAIDTLLRQRLQLKHLLTRKEWNAVYKFRASRPAAY